MRLPRLRNFLVPLGVAAAVCLLVASAIRMPRVPTVPALPDAASASLARAVERVNAEFDRQWRESGLTPAQVADDLQVLRRLSLALHGTIPSLEEIRRFEQDTAPARLERWTRHLLNDRRFADYFAERLARSFVGAETGQFIVFRRDRFVQWLSEQLQRRTPYDSIVRQMIAEEGLWTGEPATNFITAAVANEEIDENKLAGRSVRAFLGQRIDCAQCHDHPFADWKQEQFAQLAAYFGQVRMSLVGVEDAAGEFTVEDRETLEKRVISPAVPFGADWQGNEGTRRERLARWVTHPENRRFERAIANRVWGLMFGRPYFDPVDDLPDPPTGGESDLLDLLGEDFRNHNYDLRRLIEVIAASRPFRLDSAHSLDDEAQLAQLESQWAVFPLVRLRPEQMIGACLQAASVGTIDRNSHLLVRLIRFFRERDFVEAYGDLGEDELQDHAGTIPQALLRMNGKLVREVIEPNPFSSSGRITGLAGSDEACLEAVFLACLTRRPTETERKHFLAQFGAATPPQRSAIVEDMFWSMFNSPEFAWNH